MDTTTILAGLKHPNYNARYSAISSLRTSIKNSKGQLSTSTLNKIFNCLSSLLLDENWSVIQATILLLGELSPQILDLPTYIPMVLPNLITNLGNIKGVIRRSTLSTLVIFVKQLYSAELVLNTLISIGFVNGDARVRQGSILVIPQIIGPNTTGINLKILLKSLIFRLMDENPNVIMSTQQSIAYLSKIRKTEFSQIQNELDHESFTLLTQHSHDIHNALLQQFQDSISYTEIQRFSNIHFKNNIQNPSKIKFFEIIKPKTLSNLLHYKRRQEWHKAVNSANDILLSITNFCAHHKNKSKMSQTKKINDLKQIILFLCCFLEIDSEHKNSTFVCVFLKMLETLIHFDNHCLMNFGSYYIPRLVELLSNSENNSIVYQKSFEICKKIYIYSSANNCGIIIHSFADVLQQTIDTIRGSIITNIITLLLYNEHISVQPHSVDFQIIINNLCKVLNQSKSKLAYLITECFAVMHHRLGLSLLQMLQSSTINANDMNLLRERFKSQKLPILTKDGNITFRYKNINTQNNDQLFHDSIGSSKHIGYHNKVSNSNSELDTTHTQSKRHSKPSRNPSASRKIPFLSNLNQSIHSNKSLDSPTSLKSEPTLLQSRRDIYTNLSIDTNIKQSIKSHNTLIKSAGAIKSQYRPTMTASIPATMPNCNRSYQRTHSAPMHRHAAIAGQLSLLKKRKSRATSAHSTKMSMSNPLTQSQSLSNNRAKSFSNLNNTEIYNLDDVLEKEEETNANSNSYAQQYYKQQRYTNNSRSHHRQQRSHGYTNEMKTKTAKQVIGFSHSNSQRIANPIRISTQCRIKKSKRNSHSHRDIENISSNSNSELLDIRSSINTPSEPSERDIKNILTQIQSKQWNERAAALKTIRKLANDANHKDLLIPHLLDLSRYIGIEINSLRSSLSRTAIITVTDLFECFGRKLESNKVIDSLIPNLMRRAGEMSNEFISSAADKAMYAMIDNISTQKALNVLLSHSTSKSPPIRSKVAMYLEKVVSVAGLSVFNYRDYERLIRTCGTFLNDGAVNTRNYTKRIMVRLHNYKSDNFDRKLKSYLSLQQYTKVQRVLAHSKDISLTHLNTKVITPKYKKLVSHSSTASSSLVVRCNNLSLSPLNDAYQKQFEDLCCNLNSGDWKKRLRGLNELNELTENAKEYTVQNITAIIDRLGEKLTDSNAKVSVSAINHLRNMVQKAHIRSLLPKILTVISEPLCTNMAAANPSIRKNSEEAINEIMSIAEANEVVINIAKIVRFGNKRIKSHCLPKLTDAVFKMKINMSDKNSKTIHQILIGSVIPSIQSVLSLSKASTQSDLKKLIRLVHSMFHILGREMFHCENMKNLRSEQLQKLQNMVHR